MSDVTDSRANTHLTIYLNLVNSCFNGYSAVYSPVRTLGGVCRWFWAVSVVNRPWSGLQRLRCRVVVTTGNGRDTCGELRTLSARDMITLFASRRVASRNVNS